VVPRAGGDRTGTGPVARRSRGARRRRRAPGPLVRAGAADPAVDRGGEDQPGDRGGAGAERAHGEDLRLGPAEQAQLQAPLPGRRFCGSPPPPRGGAGCPPPRGVTAMRSPIRGVVVDDHALVRDRLIRLLGQSPGIEPVGQAASGLEAVEVARVAQPDVALVDLRMPDMDGIETAQRLQDVCPGVRVLILTGVESEDALIRALGVGVYGYVPKALPFEAVVRSIELAVDGGVTFPYQLSQGVVGRSGQREAES